MTRAKTITTAAAQTCEQLGACQSRPACHRCPDSKTPRPPNTTDVQIHRPKPAKLREPGLHAVPVTNFSTGGKVILSPLASSRELTARRLSERLELATSTVPVRNSTMPNSYACPELRPNPAIPSGRTAAYALPSRVGKRLHYPDGRVELVAP